MVGGQSDSGLTPPAEVQEAKAWSWSAFVSTYLPALILAVGTGIAVPVTPKIAESFHVSSEVATGVTTSFLIGSVLGTLPTGWLVDRVGRRRIMLIGPLLTAVMAFLVLTARSYPQLLAYRFFDGFASQMWLIGRLAAISHGAAPNQRGRQVSWMFGMDNTGKFVGPLLGVPIQHFFGIRAPFAAYGIFALIAFIPAFKFTKDTPRVAAVRSASDGAVVQRPSIRKIILPRLVYFGVALFAGLARGPVQAQVMYVYAAYHYHTAPASIGYLAGTAGGIALPIGFLAGWMMDRFGRKKTMVPGFTGVAVTSAGLALTYFLGLSELSFIWIYLAGILMQSLTGGSVQTVGADVAPPEARGLFLGLWRFTGQGGVALSPVLFAFLAAGVNYGSGFAFIGVSAFMVAFLVFAFVPETGGRQATAAAAAPATTSPAVATS